MIETTQLIASNGKWQLSIFSGPTSKRIAFKKKSSLKTNKLKLIIGRIRSIKAAEKMFDGSRVPNMSGNKALTVAGIEQCDKVFGVKKRPSISAKVPNSIQALTKIDATKSNNCPIVN